MIIIRMNLYSANLFNVQMRFTIKSNSGKLDTIINTTIEKMIMRKIKEKTNTTTNTYTNTYTKTA